MGKLNLNPDFDGTGEGTPTDTGKKVMVDEEILEEVEGEKEEKKPEGDKPTEEGNRSDASTDKEPIGENTDDANVDVKKRELEGLKKDEEKIDTTLTELDINIKATKERIVAKRELRRNARKESGKTEVDPEPDKDDLSDIEKEDVNRMMRVLKAKGFVQKGEVDTMRFGDAQKDAEEVFFEKNPQYRPANDKDDILYDALQAEVALFAKPKSTRDIATILIKAHDQVVKRFPSHFTKRDTKASDTAHQAKADVAGAGTGNSGASSQKKGKSESSLSQEQVQHLKDGGFSEEEIAEM